MFATTFARNRLGFLDFMYFGSVLSYQLNDHESGRHMAELWSQFSLLSIKQSSTMSMNIIRINNWLSEQEA